MNPLGMIPFTGYINSVISNSKYYRRKRMERSLKLAG